MVVALVMIAPFEFARAQSLSTSFPTLKIQIEKSTTNTDGDPDKPVITGTISNPKNSTEGGPETEDIGIKQREDQTAEYDPHEEEIDIHSADLGPITKDRGIEHEDIGVMKDDDGGAQKGNAETTWKVEKGEKASTDETETETEGEMTLKGKKILENFTASGAVFIKIPDVEGESESASKPKEIVVVGSKVKDVVREASDEEQKDLSIAPEEVDDDEDLALYASKVILDNENIKSIEVRGEDIAVSYKTTARLFGFIPVTLAQEAHTEFNEDKYGRVKVKLPWWGFLAKKDFVFDEAKLDEEFQDENIDLQNPIQKQAQIMQTLSNIMKNLHDTAK